MKKITRQEARDKIVGSILRTLRIEQLQPTAEVVASHSIFPCSVNF